MIIISYLCKQNETKRQAKGKDLPFAMPNTKQVQHKTN